MINNELVSISPLWKSMHIRLGGLIKESLESPKLGKYTYGSAGQFKPNDLIENIRSKIVQREAILMHDFIKEIWYWQPQPYLEYRKTNSNLPYRWLIDNSPSFGSCTPCLGVNPNQNRRDSNSSDVGSLPYRTDPITFQLRRCDTIENKHREERRSQRRGSGKKKLKPLLIKEILNTK